MKEIKAVIRPGKLATLRQSLMAVAGFPGMTVLKAQGCSGKARHAPATNIREELTDFTDKIRIEIVAPDELVDALVERIVAVSSTGHIGDGLVWVTDVDRAVFVYKSMPGAEAAGRYPGVK